MAKLRVTGIDEQIKQIERMSNNAPKIFKEAVYDGANIVADELRARLEQNLRDPASVSLHGSGIDLKQNESTGDLLNSFGISHIDMDKNGVVNARIGFDGYDRKGVPNQLKARVMESGTRILKKRPFFRPAVAAVKGRVRKVMKEDILRGLEKVKEKG